MAVVSRVTTYARFGDYCYRVSANHAYGGFTLTLSTLANAIHYVSLYLYSGVAGAIQISLNGAAWQDMTIIGGRTGGWVRYGVQTPASVANGSTTLYIRLTTNETFYVDAVQVEQKSYATTYIDGDQRGLYRWNGLRHGSSSTRDAQERSGGRERNLLDDYGVEVVEGTKRIGMPPVIHNLQSQSLLPGALYQGAKVLPREIELDLNYSSDSWAGFHGKRNDVIDLLKPDLTRGSQPVTIGYAGPGSAQKVYAQFYYNGGLEFGDFLSYDEVAQVRLLAPDPLWSADDQETAVLDYQDSLANTNGVLARINGAWTKLGTGFSAGASVGAVAVDFQRNRIFFGVGGMTTANGVTCNGICYWDGTTFNAMGGATKGIAGGNVTSLAVSPNGDVWLAGTFTSAGGSATKGVAKWVSSTNTFTVFNLTTTSGTAWFGCTLDKNGLLYLGGNWVGWNGVAGEDYITSYDGASWIKLGTTPFAADDYPAGGRSLVVDLNNLLIVGSSSASGTAKLRKWDGTNWTTLLTTDVTADVYTNFVNPDNTIFSGGQSISTYGGVNVNNVGLYTQNTIVALGSGLTGGVLYDIVRLSSGLYLFVGSFTAAGGLTLSDNFAFWNGYSWNHVDCDLPGSSSVNGAAALNDDLYIIFSQTGTATVAGRATVTDSGSTVAYPRLSVINANASGSCTLQWLENQSSNHRMYFNLPVQAGETVTLDLANLQKRLISDWRGTITDNPLKNSDVTNWKLLPGANTVATFITGTVTSVTALLHWIPRYWSADGGA